MGAAMRLAGTAVLTVALLALTAGCGGDRQRADATPSAAPAADAAPRRASLLPSNDDPFTVRGSGFRRRELVRVTVTRLGAATGRTRRVRAGARGTFMLGFAGFEPCRGLRGKAIGSRGSRASFVLNSVTC
jgi:hypothetical protein